MPSVVIDYLPACAEHYRDEYAIVVIDVIRATTTATTRSEEHTSELQSH